MNVTAPPRADSAAQAVEHFDVLIVGAGISGVGSAYHLTKQLPGTTFVVLEEQETFGGTWWTHQYPGIRSDSDLHTFGYSFKPWTGPPIATAAEIRAYMGEVIDENDLDEAHPLPSSHHLGELVERDQSVDHRSGQDQDSGETRHLHRELSLDVPGLLPPFRRLHARMEGDGRLSRAASSIRSAGRRISRPRARRSS